MASQIVISNTTDDSVGAQFNLIHCDYKVSKKYDKITREVDKLNHYAEITATFYAPDRDKSYIYNSYNLSTIFNGKIVIDKSLLSSINNSETERNVYFYNAKIYSLEESYNINRSSKRILTVKIMAQKISISGSDIIYKQ